MYIRTKSVYIAMCFSSVTVSDKDILLARECPFDVTMFNIAHVIIMHAHWCMHGNVCYGNPG